MPKNPLKLKIGYLYPDFLQSFCDDANVEIFAKRAKWRDIDVQIQTINANDKISASRFDFYYIGGNRADALDLALPYIRQNKDELKIASMSSIPMLAVNMGYLVFGNFFQFHNCPQREGLGILDVDTITSKKLLRGNIIGTCAFLGNKTVMGFENHTTATYLREDALPFITIQKGFGNNDKDKEEGARSYNTIGTYLSGPILAQNPHFCDFLIAAALRIKYKCKIPITRLKDDIEWYSHNYILDLK